MVLFFFVYEGNASLVAVINVSVNMLFIQINTLSIPMGGQTRFYSTIRHPGFNNQYRVNNRNMYLNLRLSRAYCTHKHTHTNGLISKFANLASLILTVGVFHWLFSLSFFLSFVPFLNIWKWQFIRIIHTISIVNKLHADLR